METTSIKAIKNLLPLIQEGLEVYQKYHKDNGTDLDLFIIGTEKEYCIKSIIAGVKNILTDLTYLTNHHNLFLKLSTYSNRTEIKNHLDNLKKNLQNKNNTSIASELDWIKSHLRTYCLRLDKSRYLDFNSAIDELCRKAISLENEIQLVRDKLKESNDTYADIQTKQNEYNKIVLELEEKKDSFFEGYNAFTSEFGDFKQLAESAKNNAQKIAENLKDTNEEKETFDDFIEKIEERERMLNQQAERTTEYENKLRTYTTDHNQKLEEAKYLIEEAKKALNYKNAEGLSAAFNTQLSNSKGFWNIYIWIIGAFIFIGITIFIGMWIVAGWWLDTSAMSSNQMIYSIVGRLSIVPFTIAGAIFCANQYTKQKNIIEDYAYKTTIAKSIIAFSEELRDKNPERYAEYLSTILKEIHQDPLRKRGKDKETITFKDSRGIIEKVIELLQSAINKS